MKQNKIVQFKQIYVNKTKFKGILESSCSFAGQRSKLVRLSLHFIISHI